MNKRRDLTSRREILSKIEHIVAITIIIPQRRRRTTTGRSRIIPESLQTPKRQPSCRRFRTHHNQNLNPSNPSPLPIICNKTIAQTPQAIAKQEMTSRSWGATSHASRARFLVRGYSIRCGETFRSLASTLISSETRLRNPRNSIKRSEGEKQDGG